MKARLADDRRSADESMMEGSNMATISESSNGTAQNGMVITYMVVMLGNQQSYDCQE